MVLKGSPVALLLGIAGAEDARRFELQKGTPVKIGRNKTSDFVIADARGVSGYHAEIVLIDADSADGPTCCVKDVSQNGTMLLADGKRRVVRPEPHLTLLSNECMLMLPHKTKTGEPRVNVTVNIIRENAQPEPVDDRRRGQGGVVDNAAPKPGDASKHKEPEAKKETAAPAEKKPAVDSEKILPRAKRRAGVEKNKSVDAKADKSRSKSCSSAGGKDDDKKNTRRRQRSRSRSNSHRQRRNSSREPRERRQDNHRDRRDSRDRRGGHRPDRRGNESDRRGYRSDRRQR